MPQLAPLFRKVLRSGATTTGASAGGVRVNGYSATYDSSGTPGGTLKKSIIQTTVSGMHGRSRQDNHHRSCNDSGESRNSSEIELNGIEVRTAIDQEVTGGADHHDGSSGSSAPRA